MASFVLQMAGVNGSGKSTLARAVSAETGAVVLDHDTTKSALLGAGIPHPPAGAASYEVIFELAHDLIDQGHSVIIDSPSAYAEIPKRGHDLATGAGVRYYFVECDCPQDTADRRVNERRARPSQVQNAVEAAQIAAAPSRRPHRPAEGTLTLDTTRPVAELVAAVVDYLHTDGASGAAMRS